MPMLMRSWQRNDVYKHSTTFGSQ